MEEHKEQRAKLEAEQASAVAGGAAIPESILTPTADAAAETTAEEPTVSRTPTGTSA
jgi:hypothetical protein